MKKENKKERKKDNSARKRESTKTKEQRENKVFLHKMSWTRGLL